MSKEKNTKQTLSQEDFLANHSALQEKEKERMTTDTCGTKPLELLENANLSGSLAKMWKALLTSPMVQSCSRYNKTWKKRVSKSNVVLFQLQASVRGIKENESGLWLTPTATDIATRSEEALQKRKDYRSQIGRKTVPPGNLSEQVMYGKPIKNMYPTPTQDSAHERTKKYKQGGTPLTMAVKMFPTPTASDMEGGAAKDVQIENGHFFRENKKGVRWGVKLRDAMEMMPTPTARDYKDAAYNPTWKESRDKSLPRTVLKNNKHGGKLNPNFVEFLMGYPMNWTKIDPTE
jgi:hypothetical protein